MEEIQTKTCLGSGWGLPAWPDDLSGELDEDCNRTRSLVATNIVCMYCTYAALSN